MTDDCIIACFVSVPRSTLTTLAPFNAFKLLSLNRISVESQLLPTCPSLSMLLLALVILGQCQATPVYNIALAALYQVPQPFRLPRPCTWSHPRLPRLLPMLFRLLIALTSNLNLLQLAKLYQHCHLVPPT